MPAMREKFARLTAAVGLFLLVALSAVRHAQAAPLGDTPNLAGLTGGDSSAKNNNINEGYIAFPPLGDEGLETDDLQLAAPEKTDTAFKISLLAGPSKTAESVNLEKEALPSRVLSAYDKTQKKVADLRDPQPIVDTILEHEKYGNNGDMFDGIARSLVNGYEAFSNFLNRLIQAPKELTRSLSKGLTAQLDVIGGKIVGL